MQAGFDERLSLLGLLLDAVTAEVKEVIHGKRVLEQLMQVLKQFYGQVARGGQQPLAVLEQLLQMETDKLENGRKSGSITTDGQQQREALLAFLAAGCDKIANENDGMQAFALLKMEFDNHVKQLKQAGKEKGVLLDNLFAFCEEVFPDGHELLLLVTELTANYYTAKYISEYGCERYFAHNQELMFYERQKKIMEELDLLDLDLTPEASSV